MKICWDNLEGLRYNSQKDRWYRSSSIFKYKDKCETCGEPFLYEIYIKNPRFCSLGCVKRSGKDNPMFDKHHSTEAQQKIREAHLGKTASKETCEKNRQSMLGKNLGKKHTEETRKKMRENHADVSGEKNPFYDKKHTEGTKNKISENHADFTG